MNQQAVLDENINAAAEKKTAEANHTKNEKKTKLSLNKMIFSAMMMQKAQKEIVLMKKGNSLLLKR